MENELNAEASSPAIYGPYQTGITVVIIANDVLGMVKVMEVGEDNNDTGLVLAIIPVGAVSQTPVVLTQGKFRIACDPGASVARLHVERPTAPFNTAIAFESHGGGTKEFAIIQKYTGVFDDTGLENVEISFINPEKCTGAISLNFGSNFNEIFNEPIYFPNATNCSWMLSYSTSFNQPVNLPSATNCDSMLYIAKAFNQPLYLPNAINCVQMLYEARSFNQPINLPSAVNCRWMLRGTISLNQPIVAPNAIDCSGMIGGSGLAWGDTVFNSMVYIPKAENCIELLIKAKKFNQPISLPSCSDAYRAFIDTALSAENINFILKSLPDRTGLETARITFTGSPGASTCDASIGTAKNWTVEV